LVAVYDANAARFLRADAVNWVEIWKGRQAALRRIGRDGQRRGSEAFAIDYVAKELSRSRVGFASWARRSVGNVPAAAQRASRARLA